ncbi:TIGR04255 family protein [Enterobacter roggenkampii]|uniref:TIGR04255 family protein n=1 Tax=Enterobacter roggenkampii TaxID=1812935 RepID=UPI0005EF3E70|nr:TIGR04255 family protein [Enterobacter roggenkampii]KJO32330.1 hypothetical protein SS06_13130 [Enterobacter roggenkampii]HCR2172840.1 TIGR04255 family protein [Enterobacter roggenkampii]
MKEQFKNSPLVELIAELHWNTGMNPEQPVFPGEQLNLHEDFFRNLTEQTSAAGYVTSERLVPNGFPFPIHVPVIRFKQNPSLGDTEARAKKLATLYQVGSGLFTINAIQPYSNWDDFKEVVRTGLRALLESKPCMLNSGFKVTLRYVNAFGESLVGNQDLRSFMSEHLGINVNLPDVMSTPPANGESSIPVIQIQTPLNFGVFKISLGEGTVNNHQALVMENAVEVNQEVAHDVDEILNELTRARDVIHSRFVELTKSLHSSMGLI